MLKRNFSTTHNIRIGILSNLPVIPSRGENSDFVADLEVEEQVDAVERVLRNLGFNFKSFLLGDNIEEVIKALKAYDVDVVINLCESAFGDSHLEMDVPAMLELLRVPYTGSPPLTLGLCQDKGLAKRILSAAGISTPKYQILHRYKDWQGGIDYPLFVKPLSEDASLGITKESFVRDDVELKKRVEYIIKYYRQPALVEEYIDGRELNIAVLGNEEPLVLPISEIIFKFNGEPKIVDYSAKWIKDNENYKRTIPECPADLKTQVKEVVERAALYSYKALHCRDYARVDIRLKGETPYVLEANPNPDLSSDAGFARSLKAEGITFEEFIERIITFALKRRSPLSLF
ncbi:MAG: ATP-grasp protein [Thermoproteota archaeon]|nr:ATP-grasp protein [Thermoproteota archaeon]